MLALNVWNLGLLKFARCKFICKKKGKNVYSRKIRCACVNQVRDSNMQILFYVDVFMYALLEQVKRQKL